MRSHRHFFLEELPIGAHSRVPHEAFLHDAVVQCIIQRHQAHAQMMCHIRAHRLILCRAVHPSRGKVRRLAKAIAPLQAHGCQRSQILHPALRRKRKGKKGGVGGDHQFPVQAPLQAQALNSVGLILVVHSPVKGVERRFGNPPGGACPPDPLFLGVQAEGQRLIEQGVLLCRKQ